MEESNTIIIKITNPKALGIIHELEELNLIKVLKNNLSSVKNKMSSKYRGIISREEGLDLNRHIHQMRQEWNSI